MTGQSLSAEEFAEAPAQMPPDPLWVDAGAAPDAPPRSHPFRRVFRQGGALLLLVSLTAIAPEPRHVAGASALTSPRLSMVGLPDALSPRSTLPEMILPYAAQDARLINLKLPFASEIAAASPYRFIPSGVDRERALDCLAAAAWYEAGDDPAGERAVIQVVLNRTRHPAYPPSVCGVVFEGSARATGCQFTFTCDGAMARTPGETAWGRARALAAQALDGAVDPLVGAATHYHADYVVPVWAPRLTKLAQVGAHIFYRFPGAWGTQAAWRKATNPVEPGIAQLARLGQAHAASGDDAAQAAFDTAFAIPLPQAAGGGLQPSTGPGLAAAIAPAAPLRPKDSAILLAVDRAAAPGRWAMEAMGKCVGQRDCQVIAWSAGDQFNINRTLPREQRTTPLFLYIRDAASGMAVTLWDCSIAPRADPAQCLPTQQAALAHLMRPRG